MFWAVRSRRPPGAQGGAVSAATGLRLVRDFPGTLLHHTVLVHATVEKKRTTSTRASNNKRTTTINHKKILHEILEHTFCLPHHVTTCRDPPGSTLPVTHLASPHRNPHHLHPFPPHSDLSCCLPFQRAVSGESLPCGRRDAATRLGPRRNTCCSQAYWASQEGHTRIGTRGGSGGNIAEEKESSGGGTEGEGERKKQ
ncbi:hypothetical protein E2C01_040288 [Portunus trituberculatus]|uniref:Uncharacterized protein n=1 Tax=Portunus trituberculatus TaxID=210409 RepID=A0A5B7FNT3_PORTR|nr:hypothetical protein [Portunus trituberculatus]